ncbi:MAG: hypothetical protein WED12_01190 [Chloroflexota bacterium]
MIRRVGLLLIILALGTVLLLDAVTEAIAITPPGGAESALLVDRWLQAMAGADADRGWEFLSVELQAEAFGGDESLYLAEVQAVDWKAVRWGQTHGRTDEGFWGGRTPLLSDPRTLPRFLLERDLVAASCGDRAAMDIWTNMPSTWFHAPRLEVVHTAGSAGRCEELFYADTGPMRPPADLVGWAWATGGNSSIRVEVIDETGLVREVSGGRDQPPVEGDVTVSDFAAGQIGVAWVGTDCPDPVQIIVRGNGDAIDLELVVVKRSGVDCAARSRTYESMLRFAGEVSADEIVATRR